MKYPLDRICIKSGVYCSSCQYKIDSGIVSEDDLEVLKALVNLEDELKFLRKGEYIKSIDLGNEVVVLLKDNFEDEELSILSKQLSSILEKRVKVIEYTNDLKKLVEQIIMPAILLGINKIWLPNGEEILNIRVPRRDRRYLARSKEQYEMLIEKISGIKARIVFE